MKCSICPKKATQQDVINGEVVRYCDGCKAMYDRIYGKDQDNMASKKTATATKKTNGKSNVVKLRPAPEPVEDAHEQDALSEEFEAEAVELHGEPLDDADPELEQAKATLTEAVADAGLDDEMEVIGEDELPEADDAKPAAHAANPRIALKRVTFAIQRLSRIDWERLGVTEGPRAIATLKLALPKLEAAKVAKKPPTRASSLEGKTARVRDKMRGQYEGVLDTPDLDALTVVSLRKGIAVCTTTGGEKVMLPTRHIEAVAS